MFCCCDDICVLCVRDFFEWIKLKSRTEETDKVRTVKGWGWEEGEETNIITASHCVICTSYKGTGKRTVVSDGADPDIKPQLNKQLTWLTRRLQGASLQTLCGTQWRFSFYSSGWHRWRRKKGWACVRRQLPEERETVVSLTSFNSVLNICRHQQCCNILTIFMIDWVMIYF